MKYLKYLLIFFPLSIILQTVKADEGILFITVCLSIIPLAAVIGNATEQLAYYTGAKAGGLISATMSNIPELMIGLFSVNAGMYNLVLASIAGSIIGNILLVLGASILLGGFKYKYQAFNKNIARSNFILLVFTAMSIVIPFSLRHAMTSKLGPSLQNGLTTISFSIAVILLVAYVSGLVFSLITHRNVFIKQEENKEEGKRAEYSLALTIGVLVAASVCVAVESRMLVDTAQQVINNYGFSELFIGIIIIPILGNVAENMSAILMALRNKVDISIEIAIGSSIQIALFVAPLLILASFMTGNPIIYIFDFFELVALLVAIALSLYVFQDGKTNWFEGLVLVCCYIILGIAFYFI